MLKKRLIGVVTVRNGWSVQSFEYQRYLPLGKTECLVDNLDRWGADEIIIQEIDRSQQQLGPNIDLIKEVSQCHLSTPIAYAGGIRSAEDAIAVVRAGAERVCVESLLKTNPDELRKIADVLGSQAIIISLSLTEIAGETNKSFAWYNYQTKTIQEVDEKITKLLSENIISEILLIDKDHEGTTLGFNFELLSNIQKSFSDINTPYILFGGFNTYSQIEKALKEPKVSAVAIGNYLSYQEHKIQQFKEQLVSTAIRPPIYHTFDNR
jgi:cyclase